MQCPIFPGFCISQAGSLRHDFFSSLFRGRVKHDPCYALVIPDDPLRSRDESIGINGLKGLFQVSVIFHVFVSHANDENQPPGLGVRGWPLAIIEDA